jgi:hypothetical protein
MSHETVAALASAIHHLEELEEIEEARSRQLRAAASLWALHGRQSIMRMGNLVQRRALNR